MTSVFPVATSLHLPSSRSRMMKLLPFPNAYTNPLPVSRNMAERRTFGLDARFGRAGVWAGVKDLVEAAYLGLLHIGERAIVEAHDYELYMALPEYRDRIHPRYLCLTDTAVGIERTRFYPLERAYRLVHGLVGLVLQWKRAVAGNDPWVVIVRNFDDAQHLATRFFAELARRAAPRDGIEAIVETQRDARDLLAHLPAMRGMKATPWTESETADTAADVVLDDAAATTLEAELADGSEAILEAGFPPLLRYYRDTGNDLAAARLAFKVLSLYNRHGYYHESRSFLPIILPCFDRLVGQEESRRMSAVSEINSCLVATGDGVQALRVVTDLAIRHITEPHLLANMNYMLAMHHLRYLEAKDIERAEHHILRAVEHIRAAGQGSKASQHAFLKAFIDNGLAFLRVWQKQYQDALDLCQSACQAVTHEMGEDRHRLHRSVLQYNMAQVYVVLGRLEEGLEAVMNLRQV
jgi:hypothetical protein